MIKAVTNKTIGAALLFCLIFGFAFYLRQFSFWLPHWQGDQSQYVMLAMKLGAGGGLDFSDYNLSQINTERVRISDPPGTEIIYPYIIQGEKQKGFVLDAYRQNGLESYDMPFFYKAPGLPVALSLSHRLLAGRDRTYAVAFSNLGEKVRAIRPSIILKSQFWAAIVPFAASLLLLTAVYFWTRRAFGEMSALAAAFVLAANPVSILTASRVWTEDLGVLFLTLAMILYRHGFKTSKAFWCGVAGMLMGVSVLTNQRNLLAAAALGIYTLLMLHSERPAAGKGSKPGWLRLLTDLRGWAFLAGLTVTTFQWFRTIHTLYGSPFWQPEAFVKMHHGKDIASAAGAQTNLQEWYNLLLDQPHGMIYYTVGTAAICWLFAAGYCTIKDGIRAGWSAAAGRAFDERALFLWCWIAVFAVYFLPQRTGEYRYLYPVYPALAILSGWMIVRAEARLSGIMARRAFSVAIVVACMAASAAYSVRVVQPVLWEQKNLISAPWK